MSIDPASFDIDALAWDKQAGLLPAIVQDARTHRVLMLGYMDRAALEATRSTGRVTFYSRSKQRLWTKGESSGHVLQLVSIETDCDVDTLLVQTIAHGPTCHLDRCSCFANAPGSFIGELDAVIAERFDARPAGSYTTKLFDAGVRAIAQKVGEEAVETIIAAIKCEGLVAEVADLIFHLAVLLERHDLDFGAVLTELERREGVSGLTEKASRSGVMPPQRGD